MPGFYVPQLTEKSEIFEIDDEEFHHIAHVCRHQAGDIILLNSGTGILAEAEITDIKKKQLSVRITQKEIKTRSQPKLAVAFALLKNKHDLMIVEKLTELGVCDLYPLQMDRSVRLASGSTIEKFQKVAISAIKQCDNAFLPEIHPVQELADLIDQLNQYLPVAALECGKTPPLLSLLKTFSSDPICLIIGPEGGFSPKEIDFMQKKKLAICSLGNHVLRAETAAIAAASIFMAARLETDRDYY
jgi:16S rRNA (uracil1498-N3)-methyltransferase